MMKLRKGVTCWWPRQVVARSVPAEAVKFNQVQTLVLDEADRMLDLGFASELENVFRVLPKSARRLFSTCYSDASAL
jgi:superfamily II DNA/RNA helicase